MIDTVALGESGLASTRLALGCMGMSEFYVGSTERDCELTISAAIGSGITMFDTADMYGPFTNELLVGRCLKPYRANVVIATKFGYVRRPDGTRLGLNGHPAYVKTACESSLRRLGGDHIDLYYLHRVDRTVPIEDTIGAMAGLVKEGKVRYLGLSEVSPTTLRRAHRVFPISAVQTEYSLISRDPELALFDTLRELNVGFVGYAPLGRGLLTGRFQAIEDVPERDYRRTSPRFAAENLTHNVALVRKLQPIAEQLNVTISQLALAWVRHRLRDGVTLVGTTHQDRLSENICSLSIRLDDVLLRTLDSLFPPSTAHGSRYPDMSRVDG